MQIPYDPLVAGKWKNDETGCRGRAVAVRPLPLAAPTDSSCEIVSCTVGRGGRRMAEERGESGTDEGVPGPMFDAIKSGSRVNRLLSLSSPYFFAVSHCEKIVCALHSNV